MIAIRYDIKNDYFEMDDSTTNLEELLTLTGILIDMCQCSSDNKFNDEAMLDYMHLIRKKNIRRAIINTKDKSKIKRGKNENKTTKDN